MRVRLVLRRRGPDPLAVHRLEAAVLGRLPVGDRRRLATEGAGDRGLRHRPRKGV